MNPCVDAMDEDKPEKDKPAKPPQFSEKEIRICKEHSKEVKQKEEKNMVVLHLLICT